MVPLLILSLELFSSRATTQRPTYAFQTWSNVVNKSLCSNNNVPIDIKIVTKTGGVGKITCALEPHPVVSNISIRLYRFPAGIFEIDSQFLVPERTSIIGASVPNDMRNPTHSPNWNTQTLFLATRGVVDYLKTYCHASDMITTRVGFVLSSFVSVTNLSYQVCKQYVCALLC